jgi:hypothetical protein
VLCAIFDMLSLKQKSKHVTLSYCVCSGIYVLVCLSHSFQLLNHLTGAHPKLGMPQKSTQCKFEFAKISNNYMGDTQICEVGLWVCEFCFGIKMGDCESSKFQTLRFTKFKTLL